MNALVLPVALPLVAAGVSMALTGRIVPQRIVAFLSSLSTLGVSIWILVDVEASETAVTVTGGWPAGPGIALVADGLSAILLVVAEVMLLGVLVFAVGQRNTDESSRFFHPTYHVLAAGVAL